jgi:D-arabinose 1-dehydrogenase-like Zn-dependent alcohol dehydrogenase
LHVGAADLAPLGQGSVMMRSSEEPHALLLSGNGQGSRRCEPIGEARGTQVRVKIHVVGICATDLALYHGSCAAPRRNPVCFGHEWAGVVEAVGETSSIFAPATG